MLQYCISSYYPSWLFASSLVDGVSRSGQAWVFSGASWVLFGTPRPPSPTIHYRSESYLKRYICYIVFHVYIIFLVDMSMQLNYIIN